MNKHLNVNKKKKNRKYKEKNVKGYDFKKRGNSFKNKKAKLKKGNFGINYNWKSKIKNTYVKGEKKSSSKRFNNFVLNNNENHRRLFTDEIEHMLNNVVENKIHLKKIDENFIVHLKRIYDLSDTWFFLKKGLEHIVSKYVLKKKKKNLQYDNINLYVKKLYNSKRNKSNLDNENLKEDEEIKLQYEKEEDHNTNTSFQQKLLFVDIEEKMFDFDEEKDENVLNEKIWKSKIKLLLKRRISSSRGEKINGSVNINDSNENSSAIECSSIPMYLRQLYAVRSEVRNVNNSYGSSNDRSNSRSNNSRHNSSYCRNSNSYSTFRNNNVNIKLLLRRKVDMSDVYNLVYDIGLSIIYDNYRIFLEKHAEDEEKIHLEIIYNKNNIFSDRINNMVILVKNNPLIYIVYVKILIDFYNNREDIFIKKSILECLKHIFMFVLPNDNLHNFEQNNKSIMNYILNILFSRFNFKEYNFSSFYFFFNALIYLYSFENFIKKLYLQYIFMLKNAMYSLIPSVFYLSANIINEFCLKKKEKKFAKLNIILEGYIMLNKGNPLLLNFLKHLITIENVRSYIAFYFFNKILSNLRFCVDHIVQWLKSRNKRKNIINEKLKSDILSITRCLYVLYKINTNSLNDITENIIYFSTYLFEIFSKNVYELFEKKNILLSEWSTQKMSYIICKSTDTGYFEDVKNYNISDHSLGAHDLTYDETEEMPEKNGIPFNGTDSRNTHINEFTNHKEKVKLCMKDDLLSNTRNNNSNRNYNNSNYKNGSNNDDDANRSCDRSSAALSRNISFSPHENGKRVNINNEEYNSVCNSSGNYKCIKEAKLNSNRASNHRSEEFGSRKNEKNMNSTNDEWSNNMKIKDHNETVRDANNVTMKKEEKKKKKSENQKKKKKLEENIFTKYCLYGYLSKKVLKLLSSILVKNIYFIIYNKCIMLKSRNNSSFSSRGRSLNESAENQYLNSLNFLSLLKIIKNVESYKIKINFLVIMFLLLYSSQQIDDNVYCFYYSILRNLNYYESEHTYSFYSLLTVLILTDNNLMRNVSFIKRIFQHSIHSKESSAHLFSLIMIRYIIFKKNLLMKYLYNDENKLYEQNMDYVKNTYIIKFNKYHKGEDTKINDRLFAYNKSLNNPLDANSILTHLYEFYNYSTLLNDNFKHVLFEFRNISVFNNEAYETKKYHLIKSSSINRYGDKIAYDPNGRKSRENASIVNGKLGKECVLSSKGYKNNAVNGHIIGEDDDIIINIGRRNYGSNKEDRASGKKDDVRNNDGVPGYLCPSKGEGIDHLQENVQGNLQVNSHGQSDKQSHHNLGKYSHNYSYTTSTVINIMEKLSQKYKNAKIQTNVLNIFNNFIHDSCINGKRDETKEINKVKSKLMDNMYQKYFYDILYSYNNNSFKKFKDKYEVKKKQGDDGDASASSIDEEQEEDEFLDDFITKNFDIDKNLDDDVLYHNKLYKSKKKKRKNDEQNNFSKDEKNVKHFSKKKKVKEGNERTDDILEFSDFAKLKKKKKKKRDK
ncbi:large ribosomal subunit nuclear export factor [Plasmodium brasilianum]|uniref:Large ribosomal subunit nuclear export factor n=1 Tax=Plasmodium brasilianum TaxID=5824 RepID=A0ACB9Y7E7_PLABR|nr:large ribosomal subunit nuclear export factor [Plasmodium brasilianum]